LYAFRKLATGQRWSLVGVDVLVLVVCCEIPCLPLGTGTARVFAFEGAAVAGVVAKLGPVAQASFDG
jgi:hypothetical protein